jgi:ParB family chromosome partitioning protein
MKLEKLSTINVENSYLRMDTNVSDLEKSIEAVGLVAPLVIDQNKNLLAGGRRYQALINLGWKEALCIEVQGNEYQKELISIDENMVRKDLGKIELEEHLRRAKELYTKILNQDSTKREEALLAFQEEMEKNETGDSEASEKNEIPEIEVIASQKFVKDVSEKTGMSPRQIYQAIERDEKSAPEVKKARGRGELSIGQTNEIIKLPKGEQKKLLHLIKDKNIGEIKKMVVEARENGIEAAIEEGLKEETHVREMKQLKGLLKKMNKIVGRLELEKVLLQGELAFDIHGEFENLVGLMGKVTLPNRKVSSKQSLNSEGSVSLN